MGQIQRKSLDSPDEVRSLQRGSGELTRIGSQIIGRAVLEPGWRWSIDVQPMMGTASCPIHHLQLVLSGRLGIRMDDGEELEAGPNDIVDIPAGHDAWVVGDEPAIVLDVAGNVDVMGVPMGHQRAVVTLLMSDIVDSTATAARLGDRPWRQMLDDHNRAVRMELGRFGGTEVSTTGDGFLATFPTAAGALRCAAAMHRVLADVGTRVRIGVHTGEVEVAPDGIGGLAVHAVARIMALAEGDEVLASAVTAALTEGSGLRLEPAGSHRVKGFDRPIEVYRLA